MGANRMTGEAFYAYFATLAARLRRVRVCCGDWSRVVTDGALAYGNTVGILLDPPYSGDVRTKDLYRQDAHDVAEDVLRWALAHADNPRYRIALCGYSNETHEAALPAAWTRLSWKANAAYQTAGGSGGNRENRKKEMIWFSPHCLRGKARMF